MTKYEDAVAAYKSIYDHIVGHVGTGFPCRTHQQAMEFMELVMKADQDELQRLRVFADEEERSDDR